MLFKLHVWLRCNKTPPTFLIWPIREKDRFEASCSTLRTPVYDQTSQSLLRKHTLHLTNEHEARWWCKQPWFGSAGTPIGDQMLSVDLKITDTWLKVGCGLTLCCQTLFLERVVQTSCCQSDRLDLEDSCRAEEVSVFSESSVLWISFVLYQEYLGFKWNFLLRIF